MSLAPRGVLRKALDVAREVSRGEDMTFQIVCSGAGSPRKLLFQNHQHSAQGAWLNVLLFQQGPIVSLEGAMNAIFSSSGTLGVMLNA